MTKLIRLTFICTALTSLSACGFYNTVTDTRHNPNRTYMETYQTSVCSPWELKEGRCDDSYIDRMYTLDGRYLGTVERQAPASSAKRKIK